MKTETKNSELEKFIEETRNGKYNNGIDNSQFVNVRYDYYIVEDKGNISQNDIILYGLSK